jgi:hypothetical protein
MREVAAVVIFLVFSVFTYAAPVHLRCESVQNPLGIDALTPRLSWQSDNKENNWKQSAYQILLASSAEQLSAGHGNVWDSGKVSSGESIGIAYGGPKLESRKRYYWTCVYGTRLERRCNLPKVRGLRLDFSTRRIGRRGGLRGRILRKLRTARASAGYGWQGRTL